MRFSCTRFCWTNANSLEIASKADESIIQLAMRECDCWSADEVEDVDGGCVDAPSTTSSAFKGELALRTGFNGLTSGEILDLSKGNSRLPKVKTCCRYRRCSLSCSTHSWNVSNVFACAQTKTRNAIYKLKSFKQACLMRITGLWILKKSRLIYFK